MATCNCTGACRMPGGRCGGTMSLSCDKIITRDRTAEEQSFLDKMTPSYNIPHDDVIHSLIRRVEILEETAEENRKMFRMCIDYLNQQVK